METVFLFLGGWYRSNRPKFMYLCSVLYVLNYINSLYSLFLPLMDTHFFRLSNRYCSDNNNPTRVSGSHRSGVLNRDTLVDVWIRKVRWSVNIWSTSLFGWGSLVGSTWIVHNLTSSLVCHQRKVTTCSSTKDNGPQKRKKKNINSPSSLRLVRDTKNKKTQMLLYCQMYYIE